MYTLPIGLNIEAWSIWETWRKREKKKPITASAAKLQFELLLKHTEAAQSDIINHSIQNDYQGLFEPRTPPVSSEQEQGFIEKHTDSEWREGL